MKQEPSELEGSRIWVLLAEAMRPFHRRGTAPRKR